MIRFYNGRVLHFGGGMRIGREEVWVDGSQITYVGDQRADAPVFEREIDLRGDLLLPGFKNAHTHSPMTFLRSLADDMPLDRWLKEMIWPNEAHLTEEAVYDLTKLAIMEYLSSGITACFDMYAHSESYVQANIDAGFRTVLCSAYNDFDKDITQLERDYLRYNAIHPRISFLLGMHAEYTTCMERMQYVVGLAEKYQAPCFTHLSETKAEVEGCLQRYGKTPPQFLWDLGFFRYGGGGYHCVWMTEEDMQLFADHGLFAVTNPASNLKLASGIAPITRMQEKGVPLAIGTDGPASNNALDMFREMYLVTALQKVQTGDASACPAETVLEMACVGGARAMGLRDCVDVAEGMKADLTVLNLRRPNMQPINNIMKNVVLSGSKENVRLTMVDGKILYEDGEFYLDESAEEICRRAQAFTESLR